jgi:D-glycero-D-manno-heptose 1,7-bisphosphate phosphatase
MLKFIIDNKKNHTKFLFLDRDGTLIPEPGDYWIRNKKEIQNLNFDPSLMKRLISLNFGLIVITNQRGIALQEVKLDDYIEICNKIENLLKQHGIDITAILTCPHDSNCDYCRKPKPGMILEAAKMYKIDLEKSWTIGDNQSDIEAGINAKTKVVMCKKSSDEKLQHYPVFSSMNEALMYVIESEVNQ